MFPVDTIKTRMQALAHPGQQVSWSARRRHTFHRAAAALKPHRRSSAAAAAAAHLARPRALRGPPARGRPRPLPRRLSDGARRGVRRRRFVAPLAADRASAQALASHLDLINSTLTALSSRLPRPTQTRAAPPMPSTSPPTRRPKSSTRAAPPTRPRGRTRSRPRPRARPRRSSTTAA
jgi:hypothetical protein